MRYVSSDDELYNEDFELPKKTRKPREKIRKAKYAIPDADDYMYD